MTDPRLTALVQEMRDIHEREVALRDSPDPRTPGAARAWSMGAAFVTGYFLPKLDHLARQPEPEKCPSRWPDANGWSCEKPAGHSGDHFNHGIGEWLPGSRLAPRPSGGKT